MWGVEGGGGGVEGGVEGGETLRRFKYDRSVYQYWVETEWTGEALDRQMEEERLSVESSKTDLQISTTFEGEGDETEEGVGASVLEEEAGPNLW